MDEDIFCIVPAPCLVVMFAPVRHEVTQVDPSINAMDRATRELHVQAAQHNLFVVQP